MRAAVRRNFSTVVGRKLLTVRKQRSTGDAMAAQRAAAGFGEPQGIGSTTLATLDEQNRCQVGPTILPDRPRAGSQ